MNYFTHAIRFTDRPLFMAGTAVPDWLSVIDRQVRVRSKTLEPLLPSLPDDEREIAEGILQHLRDDQWFHGTPGFAMATARLSSAFREVTSDPEFPASFLGHVVMELQLDAALQARHPEMMVIYYDVLRSVDPYLVEAVVNRASRVPTDRLSQLIPLYIEERFLEDYRDPVRLLRRLNQVMRRVKLPGLPEAVLPALERGAQIVEDHFDELLPAELFPWPSPALRTLR